MRDYPMNHAKYRTSAHLPGGTFPRHAKAPAARWSNQEDCRQDKRQAQRSSFQGTARGGQFQEDMRLKQTVAQAHRGEATRLLSVARSSHAPFHAAAIGRQSALMTNELTKMRS